MEEKTDQETREELEKKALEELEKMSDEEKEQLKEQWDHIDRRYRNELRLRREKRRYLSLLTKYLEESNTSQTR